MGTAVQCEQNLFCGVNTVKDPDSMTDLEMKHLPVISSPESIKKGDCFEVMIEVGKHMQHPNEPSHYIEFIELYADDTYLARLDLTARMTGPVMKVSVALDHIHEKLRAFAHCNLHGTWEGQAEITIVE